MQFDVCLQNQIADRVLSNFMKYILLIVCCIAIFILIAQIMIAKNTDTTEQQPYNVLLQDNDIEIRYYPEVLVAQVEDEDPSIRGSASHNFRRLAGYIFGGNTAGEKIAMTAPVHMENTSAGTRMRFVMPSAMDSNRLPVPNDKGIVFSTLPPDTVAVIRFSGFASDKDIREKEVLLQQWLNDKKIPATSGFRYLGYNPPYQLVNRRNEVAVSIRWVK